MVQVMLNGLISMHLRLKHFVVIVINLCNEDKVERTNSCLVAYKGLIS